MTYLSELKYFQLNQFNGSKLLTFNEKRKVLNDTNKQRNRRRRELCCTYIKEFCDKSSIHGVKNLTDNGLLKFEKIIWAIILLATSICAVYLYLQLAEDYRNHRIQTIVEDSVYPVFYIYFPSIAICTRYRINWSKMPAAEANFLAPNTLPSTVRTFREFFQRFEDFYFGKFSNFRGMEALQLDPINNISIIDVMRFLAYTSDDLFGEDGQCMWRKETYNCSDLFTLERTEVGFCQVFNSVMSRKGQERAMQDKFYPHRNSWSTEGTGLQIQVRLNISQQRPGWKKSNGIFFFLKQPHQWNSNFQVITSNTDSRIIISPQLTETSQDTRGISPDIRNCLFEDEKHHRFYKKISGFKYLRNNCRTQCHHEYIMQYCRCTIPLLFPEWGNANYSACTPKDFKCLNFYEKIFRTERQTFEKDFFQDAGESMVCSCMNSCNTIVFTNSLTNFPMQSTREDIEQIKLDIFYQSDYMLKYRTILSYTFVELLGNFGGIIGLFLGASMLSAVEIVYYFTIGVVVYARREQAHEQGFKSKRKQFKVRPMMEVKAQPSQEVKF